MTPLEFLARLSALVAPPRYPLLRYHGVLAPRSSWRRDVVPRQPGPATKACHVTPKSADANDGKPVERAPPKPASRGGISRPVAKREPRASRREPPNPVRPDVATGPVAATPAALVAPNILSVKHWDRLLGGALYAATTRVDWPTLLRRTFDVDVLKCVRCGGRLRVLGEVTEPAMVRLVLESLSMPAEAPPVARARDPTDLLGDDAET